MSESISPASSEASGSSDAAGPAAQTAVGSAGALLRHGRLAAGLHIAALAVSMKVPVRKLEALEADRFDLLPDAVFVRALAGSVCRALKMDSAPVLALLPRSAPPRLSAVSEHTGEAFTSSDNSWGRPAWRSVSKPVVGSAAVLVIGALVLVAWPLMSGGPGADDLATSTGTPANVSSVNVPVVEVVTPMPQVLAPVITAGFPTAAGLAAGSSAVPAVAPSVAPSAAPTATLLATPPAVAPRTVQALASGIVVFQPSAASWIEVTDAQSSVVLRRMVAAGEVAGASGALPLSVVVGRADVTKVQVRGQAFDLSSIARENVARFEVK